ncbi:MAG: helix-turn-helix domain-containing protein [Planctomycetes bacterium]|nr:helix-turn-helix domain-containing protein [Planctomycetota bacterium]
MEKLLALKEVSRSLSVSIYTLRRMVRRGEIPVIKVGQRWRVEAGALEFYLRSRQQFSGDITQSKLYFRDEILAHYRTDVRYYVQEGVHRGRLGLKQDRRDIHALKSLPGSSGKGPKDVPGLFYELYFWKAKLKDGSIVVMVKPEAFYKLPGAEQHKWRPYTITNPVI